MRASWTSVIVAGAMCGVVVYAAAQEAPATRPAGSEAGAAPAGLHQSDPALASSLSEKTEKETT